MEKLTLDEFLEIYKTVGEVGAKLAVSNVGPVDFDDLVDNAPECIKYFKDRMTGYHWMLLLEKRPEDADDCRWEKITSAQMVNLLITQPQFVNHTRWHEFKDHHWLELLNRKPQFAKYFYTLPVDKREYFWDMSIDILRLTSGAVHAG